MNNIEGNPKMAPEKDPRLKRLKKAAKNAVRITTAGAVLGMGSISNASAEPFHSPFSSDQNKNTLITNEPMPSQNPGLLQMEGDMANYESTNTIDPYFQSTWDRTDKLVASGDVKRTWIWGPAPISPVIEEPYNGTTRKVQYFDKSRMEENPGAQFPWNVTNGLLVRDMIKGQIQTGDATFDAHAPANIQVAGDKEAGNGPTYAALAKVLNTVPDGIYQDSKVVATIDADGNVGSDGNLAREYPEVTYQEKVPETGHTVASVFWNFMESQGPIVDENGNETNGLIFANPYFATGYPITEAYWTKVKVGGVEKDVLVQAFERRILTYTPSNEDGWKVENGNVGDDYKNWRYPNGVEQGQQLVKDIEIPGMDVYSSPDVKISLNDASPIANENALEALLKQYFSGEEFTINVFANSADVLKQTGTGYSVSIGGDNTFTGTGIDMGQVMHEKIDVTPDGKNCTISINLPQISTDPTTRTNQEAAVNVWLSKRILLDIYAKNTHPPLPAEYGSTIGPMYRAELFQTEY